jgi:hypothetical protein
MINTSVGTDKNRQEDGFSVQYIKQNKGGKDERYEGN